MIQNDRILNEWIKLMMEEIKQCCMGNVCLQSMRENLIMDFMKWVFIMHSFLQSIQNCISLQSVVR